MWEQITPGFDESVPLTKAPALHFAAPGGVASRERSRLKNGEPKWGETGKKQLKGGLGAGQADALRPIKEEKGKNVTRISIFSYKER